MFVKTTDDDRPAVNISLCHEIAVEAVDFLRGSEPIEPRYRVVAVRSGIDDRETWELFRSTERGPEGKVECQKFLDRLMFSIRR